MSLFLLALEVLVRESRIIMPSALGGADDVMVNTPILCSLGIRFNSLACMSLMVLWAAKLGFRFVYKFL